MSRKSKYGRNNIVSDFLLEISWVKDEIVIPVSDHSLET